VAPRPANFGDEEAGGGVGGGVADCEDDVSQFWADSIK
jgi:hypothetical protein